MAKKHFNKKFVNDILGPLRKHDFCCEPLKTNNNKYIISKDGHKIIVHGGVSCFHPLRRWLKTTYDFDLTSVI